MYGAIFGDIIGSRFEFDRGGKTKDFELFTNEDDFTDDTVMTVAVAEGLLNSGKDADIDIIKSEVIKSMKEWGHRYPNAGYGVRFYSWLFGQKNPKPYGSYGNGSAMRVSAAGWLYDSVERVREVAKATAEVTHNHPEGIKGAECTAAVICLARTKLPKDRIKEYVISEFCYDLHESVDEMRRRHRHDESCQDTLPKALVSFFEGNSYEDVVRNAVSLGGDTDTIAAIAGAMGEAYYGIPLTIMAEGNGYLTEDILEVIRRFDVALGRVNDHDEVESLYENNKYIKLAVDNIYDVGTTEALITLLQVICKRIIEEGQVPTPMVDENHVFSDIDINTICMGDEMPLNQEMRLTFDTMKDSENKQWLPLFTDQDELYKGETANIIMNIPIENIIRSGLNSERAEGVVINPFGQAFTLTKDMLKAIMEHLPETNVEN